MNTYRSPLRRSRGAHLVNPPFPKVVSEPEPDETPQSEARLPDTIPFPGIRRSASLHVPVSLKAFLHLFWLLALVTLILSAGSIFNSGVLF